MDLISFARANLAFYEFDDYDGNARDWILDLERVIGSNCAWFFDIIPSFRSSGLYDVSSLFYKFSNML